MRVDICIDIDQLGDLDGDNYILEDLEIIES